MKQTFYSSQFVIKAYTKENSYYLYVDKENLDNVRFINSEKISNIYSITRFNLNKDTYKLLEEFILDLKEKYKNEYEFKIEILPETQIKEGLYLPHPQNIIINPNTIIGKNCTILQDVTIGNNNYKGLNNLAILGDSISIGAGTKIIGPVIIGSNTIIGANSVVVKSFENPNQIIAGNPAKLIRKEANMYVHNQYLREKNE